MAKKAKKFIRGLGSSSVLSDRDWMTIISALLHDKNAQSKQLAQTLLGKTKHGRQVRMLRLVHDHNPTVAEMQKTTKMSRRTIFRYLNSLETYGVRFSMGDDFRYQLDKLPKDLERLL